MIKIYILATNKLKPRKYILETAAQLLIMNKRIKEIIFSTYGVGLRDSDIVTYPKYAPHLYPSPPCNYLKNDFFSDC